MSKFSAGDTVMLGGQRRVVEKVGRRWMWIVGYPYVFDKDTGKERTMTGAPRTVITIAEWEERAQKTLLIGELRKRGVCIERPHWGRFTIETLTSILTIIEDAQ